MNNQPSNRSISAGLVFAVLLWGANNAATKYLLVFWPPIMVGCTRFVFAGLILLALFRWTTFFGKLVPITPELNRFLWLHGGLNLALYIIAFNWALSLIPVAHVALYLGASPVWALLWEGKQEINWKTFQRYFSAALALMGVVILFWPALHGGVGSLLGEFLALIASVLWTNYGRQCRSLGAKLSGPEISACTFWRAGVWAAPFALFEISTSTPALRIDLVLIQLFCVLGSGVIAFALWNNALRHWKTSKVYLFNNLVPISSMTWAHLFLGEKITPTFWIAMSCIISGVILGQTNWQKLLGRRWKPPAP